MYLNIKRSSVLPSTSVAIFIAAFFLFNWRTSHNACSKSIVDLQNNNHSESKKQRRLWVWDGVRGPVCSTDGLLFYFFTGSCLSICSCWFFCSAVPAVDQWTKTELLCKSSEQEIDSRPFQRRQLLTLENGAIFCLIDWLIGGLFSWRFLGLFLMCVLFACTFLFLYCLKEPVCVRVLNLHVLNLKATLAGLVHNREIFISCSRAAWTMKGNYVDNQPWPVFTKWEHRPQLSHHYITGNTRTAGEELSLSYFYQILIRMGSCQTTQS